jgi:hypothetical protein
MVMWVPSGGGPLTLAMVPQVVQVVVGGCIRDNLRSLVKNRFRTPLWERWRKLTFVIIRNLRNTARKTLQYSEMVQRIVGHVIAEHREMHAISSDIIHLVVFRFHF